MSDEDARNVKHDALETPGRDLTPTHEPLALGQQELWFLDALSPGKPTYNVCTAFQLIGSLDMLVLKKALTYLIERHDTLRSTFADEAGVPYQTVGDPVLADLAVTDVADLDGEGRASAVENTLLVEADTPFDLKTGPLYRFHIIRVQPEEHVLCLTLHHIITDGWSMGILNNELAYVYAALLNDAEPALDPLPFRYLDYVRWQQDLRQGPMDEDLRYWEQHLAGLPVLELPTDRPRLPEPSHRGDKVFLELPSTLLPAARLATQQYGVSLVMLLAASLTAVFSRYTGQDDIPLGVSMLGRIEPEHESLVGLFTNMVVLRCDLSGNPSMTDLLARTADEVLNAYDHQNVPFGVVVDRVQPVRDPGRNPLFQVALQLLGDANSGSQLALGETTAIALRTPGTRSRFDMVFNFVESTDNLRLEVEYSIELFDRARIDALIEHACRVLEAICTKPSLHLSELPLVSEVERQQLLAAGQGEPSGFPPEPVHAAVARIAAQHPDVDAVVLNGESLSYEELNRRAETLARYLRAQGVLHEQIVAIAMRRDLAVLVALLGVMKAGAAYTVLDPDHPVSRMEFMLRDTGAPLLLTTSELLDRLPQPDGWRVVQLDKEWSEIQAAPQTEGEPAVSGQSLAYVLYTSGSSGKPKGVQVEHRALLSAVRAYGQVCGLHAGDRMLQLSALSFDMAHGEIFAGLIVGATLVMVPSGEETPDALFRLIRDARLTFISMAPAMLALVDADPYPCLEKMMAGGEALSAELVNKWVRPGRRLLNLYGPTEATVACTGCRCDPGVVWSSSPPIGRPFPDRSLYVVDRWGNLVPQGVPGELLIGGDEGLARGYLNQPELTERLFVEDPFFPGRRVYRSGDLVRWTSDWQLDFLGRLDFQVKLNGLRIELEEIEAALLSHPQVGMAAATLRPSQRGETVLAGYVTPVSGGAAPDLASVRRHLREQLPGYMVPTAWLVLPELPLTTARKVNRKALPEPDTDIDDGAEFVPPRSQTEIRVAKALTDVLHRPRIGLNDNLFELGGNSLAAMRVMSRLSKEFGVRIPVRTLYNAEDIGGVARIIDGILEAHREKRAVRP